MDEEQIKEGEMYCAIEGCGIVDESHTAYCSKHGRSPHRIKEKVEVTEKKKDQEGFRNHIKAWDSKGIPRDWDDILKLAELYNVPEPHPDQIEMIRMENEVEKNMTKFDRWMDNHKKLFFGLVAFVYILLLAGSVGWAMFSGGAWK